MFFRGKIRGRVQYVDEEATGKGRAPSLRTKSMSMVSRKRDAGITRIEPVEVFKVGRRVRNKRCSAM